MKRWASEDNAIHKLKGRDKDNIPLVSFRELLYPQHPIIRLMPIVGGGPQDDVFCLGCETVHNHYAGCTANAA